MPKIRVINLKGEPYARGRKHGAKLKEEINTLYLAWRDKVMEKLPVKMDMEEINRFIGAHIPFVKKIAPDIHEEMNGIADGAKISYQKVLLLNCFAEIERFFLPAIAVKFKQKPNTFFNNACTGFGIYGKASMNKKVYVGQGWDMESYWEPIILRIQSEAADPDLLLFSNPGIVGASGINSHGLALCNTGICTSDQRPGLPYPILVRKALEKKVLSDMMGVIITAPRTTGIGYILGSSFSAVCLQTSATDYSFSYPQEGYFALGNHFEDPALKKHEMDLIFGIDSLVRVGRMRQLLYESYGELNVKIIEKILRDHANYPQSICRHDAGNSIINRTIASFIYSPEENIIFIAKGNPCENPFERIPLC